MSKQHQQNAAKAMKQAWVNARQYAEQHGGKPSQYFIFALREAWAEIKQSQTATIIDVTTINGTQVKINVKTLVVTAIKEGIQVNVNCDRVIKSDVKNFDKHSSFKGIVVVLFGNMTDGKRATVVLDKESSDKFDAIYQEVSKEKELEEAKKKAEAQEIERKTIRIFLSTRGWGDYSSLEWVGTVDTLNDEIVAQAKKSLQTEYDVDNRNLTDADLYQKVQEAKQKWFENQKEKQKNKEIAQKIVDNASEAVKKAFVECKGDPERLHDDIDHPLYWSVWEYVDALSKLD